MKIDVFSHISTSKYRDAIERLVISKTEIRDRAIMFAKNMSDLNSRFAMMDQFDQYAQILTLAEPPIEQLADATHAPELAMIANDSLAELVNKYPKRFKAAVAVVPINNIKATLNEIDRAINDLKLKGILLATNINDKPLDSPEFLPVYDKMAYYDLPIWFHPTGGDEYTDYRTESKSIYRIRSLIGWPVETSVVMLRLACSGILEKYPNLKFITHHCGGVVPFLAGRIAEIGPKNLMEKAKYQALTKEPVDYLKMFYGDTAIYGEVPALMLGYHFFGPEHLLFGTDMPLGSFSIQGIAGLRAAVSGIDKMEISEADRKKIYEENVRKILRLN